MKTCICCGTQADDAAATCANCGEASWAAIDAMPIEVESEAIPEGFLSPAPIVDPDTAIEVPRVRRNKRPN
jgi:hypothetical protein